MAHEDGKWRLLRLLNPEMCATCRFASTARATMDDGSLRAVLRCGRADCDNWVSDPDPDEPAITQVEDDAA